MNTLLNMFLILYMSLCIYYVNADYTCVCSYGVETAVYEKPDMSGTVIGYMYEFDCKPKTIRSMDRDGFIGIQFEKQNGFIENSGQIQIQTCAGDASPSDLVPATAHTTTTNPTTHRATPVLVNTSTVPTNLPPQAASTTPPTVQSTSKTTTAIVPPTTVTTISTVPSTKVIITTTTLPSPSTSNTETAKTTVTIPPTTTTKSTTNSTTAKPPTTTTIQQTSTTSRQTTTHLPTTVPSTSTTTSQRPTTTIKPAVATGHVHLACSCPNGWVSYRESCYLFGHQQGGMSFTDAQHFCKHHHHSKLVVIGNSAENAFLKNYLSKLQKENYWLGLTDWDIEGQWKWRFSQQPLTFTDWRPGQPDSWHGINEDCALFYSEFNFVWDDGPCHSSNQPLCEIYKGSYRPSNAIFG